MKKTALVIGGGITGCCAAHLLSQKEFDVTLVEQASILGGGVKTYHYGGHPFTYGPRHFLTKNETVFNYINGVIPMRRIQEHEFLTYVECDGNFYTYPIHADDIPLMPDREQIQKELGKRKPIESPKNLEEYWIQSIGRTLYSKFVESYSKKMWKIESNILIDDFAWSPKGVALNTGPKQAWTTHISAFPEALNGYDDYFQIATRSARVLLKTTIADYDIEQRRVQIGTDWAQFDIIISTVSPEVIFKNAFGPLTWLGRDFLQLVLPMEEVFPKNVYFLYYAGEEPFTRIVEYKKFYRNKAPTSLLGIEIPSHRNKLYAYPISSEQAKAQKYLDALPKNVYSIGRFGSYQYKLDIAPSFEQCFKVIDSL